MSRQKFPYPSECSDLWPSKYTSLMAESTLLGLEWTYSLAQCQRFCLFLMVRKQCDCFHPLYLDIYGARKEFPPCDLTSNGKRQRRLSDSCLLLKIRSAKHFFAEHKLAQRILLDKCKMTWKNNHLNQMVDQNEHPNFVSQTKWRPFFPFDLYVTRKFRSKVWSLKSIMRQLCRPFCRGRQLSLKNPGFVCINPVSRLSFVPQEPTESALTKLYTSQKRTTRLASVKCLAQPLNTKPPIQQPNFHPGG